ncbi:anthranilate phosphoribosyltransferase [Desulfohalotomaculum tongense]|uniref:anthranilate phosphoribosyltransferase n=1 Tax=Desulforadius tongensis TaxID=1216062 RepID=UPI00195BE7FB|nr:anthranilate phosphoribosyltransferase [Desulforadius tongensis]MBM7854654.1 anthranilate phosphoribosyltransferase [Desulforadius tongensis]
MISQAIKKLVAGEHLTENEAVNVMTEIMEGRASAAQIAALLTALRLKGEHVDEITGFARVMRQKAVPVKSKHPLLVDTCGTGGDGARTFNISTTAAFVLAGAGAKVAKHGNRSVSSCCGSADLLEALGVRINLTAEQAGRCLDECGICFLFAPQLHRAMKHAAAPRKEIGIRTVFNILGPLTNPAGAQAQVLGVYDAGLVDKLARVLARLGSKRVFVLHGAGGLDEVSLAGPTVVCAVWEGRITGYTINPTDYGFAPAPVEALAGGTAEENAAITREILKGAGGPRRDAVVLNAALGLICAGKAADIAAGIKLAQWSIDSGAAAAKLEELVRFTAALPGRGVVSF